MLNTGKPAIGAGKCDVTLEFPAQNIRVPITRGRYEEFLKTARSYLLNATILQKNKLIDGKLNDLQKLQTALRAKPGDQSLIVQTRAAYLALNREIAAQQELFDADGGDGDFYGKVAEVVGPGITRDELMIYESLSGIRP
jgi:hypothetical protein